MAGYSKTPLSRKLGIRENSRVKLEQAPPRFVELLAPLPVNSRVSGRLEGRVDIWHLFTRSKKNLPARLQKAMRGIARDGAIWVSWPKKSSGESTDMTEDEIRRAALPLGLVDVKVCAIDDTWSGLKLMIRKANR